MFCDLVWIQTNIKTNYIIYTIFISVYASGKIPVTFLKKIYIYIYIYKDNHKIANEFVFKVVYL
jgi:hypothetical protein